MLFLLIFTHDSFLIVVALIQWTLKCFSPNRTEVVTSGKNLIQLLRPAKVLFHQKVSDFNKEHLQQPKGFCSFKKKKLKRPPLSASPNFPLGNFGNKFLQNSNSETEGHRPCKSLIKSCSQTNARATKSEKPVYRPRLRTSSPWRDRLWKAARSAAGVASLRSATGPLPPFANQQAGKQWERQCRLLPRRGSTHRQFELGGNVLGRCCSLRPCLSNLAFLSAFRGVIPALWSEDCRSSGYSCCLLSSFILTRHFPQ